MDALKSMKVSQAITPTAGAAGVTAINGAALDMAGYEGVLMIVTWGAIVATGVQSINAAQATSSGGTYADLAGTGQTVADSDDETINVIDLYKPQEQFVRLEVARATANSTIAAATYIQYGARKSPVTHGANVTTETHISPAEGAA